MMSNPITTEQITLRGETVELIPLTTAHYEELTKLAGDKRIWEFYAFDGSNPQIFEQVLNSTLKKKETGEQYPFVIKLRHNGKIIGSTRFMEIVPKDRKLEIGGTWLAPQYWATRVNPESKLLLLSYCFEQLHLVRVQLKTDVLNMRSRKAIEKIGAQYEGILRNELIRANGTNRDSAFYSILDREWPDVKQQLIQQVKHKSKPI